MDWPNAAPFAAAITFDMDADSLIHAADPEGWKRPYAISMGQYGPTIGVPRILETYRRLGLSRRSLQAGTRSAATAGSTKTPPPGPLPNRPRIWTARLTRWQRFPATGPRDTGHRSIS
jgi:hypothetical protein